MRVALLVTPVLLIGCGASQPQSAPVGQNVAAPTAAARRALIPVCPPADGKDAQPSPAQIDGLGKPAGETQFALTHDVTEFRVRLLNHALPRDGSVRVREQSWAEGECRLTLWSVRQENRWRVIEWLRWSAGDAF